MKLLEVNKNVLDRELLKQFCTFIDKHMGLHYPKERWQDLEKKLVLIKNSFGFDDTAACLDWLLKNPMDKDKLDVLTFHLTIGETYFFRDTQLFAILEQEIIPDILRRHQKDRSIRIWSTACCTGEEPYSIAMVLHRLIPDIQDWKISILGTDINPEFLLKAKKAVYKKWSFRATDPNILERYFKINKDGTFTLIPEIRKMVHFESLNLADDAYPDLIKGINEMDLIFCHNILIYFSEHQIKKTVHKLTESLCSQGWLSVTAVEVPFITEPELNTHRYTGAVFFKKEASSKKTEQQLLKPAKAAAIPPLKKKSIEQPLSLAPPKPQTLPIKAKAAIKPDSEEEIFDEALRLYKQKAYQQVIALLLPSLTPFQDDSTSIKKNLQKVTLLIRTYANQGNLLSALEWVEIALKADDLDPLLHYLHATLLQDQGNIEEAIKSVKRALFIESNFMMAYLMLGILEKQQGNKKAATRNFKTASQLIDNHLPAEILLNTDEFSTDYLKDLISNNLKSL